MPDDDALMRLVRRIAEAQARTTPPLRSTSDPARSTAGDHSLLQSPPSGQAVPYGPHRVTAGGGDDASSEFIGRRNRGGR